MSGAGLEAAWHLLAQAELRYSPCEQGRLQWQRWPCRGSESGLPLVLLHGGFGSWNHWLANIPGLREQREVWTVDLPGLGESGDISRDAQPEDFVHWLKLGLAELLGEHTQFELAGFSFGALLGAVLAAQLGEQCKRFTAIGAAGCGELHVQVSLQRPPAPDVDREQAEAVHRANLRALMFSANADIDELAVYLHAHNLQRHRFNSRALSLTTSFVDALPEIAATLVGVWGSEDATAGGADAIEARRKAFTTAQPNAGFHVLAGVGHWAMYEDPVAINRVLLADS